MASASDDPIAFWLKLGALDKLEQALLDGYGDQLRGRSSRIPQVARFLKQVPAVQAQMEEMHEGAMQGRLEEVRSLAEERRQLAFCRDQQGASPLHKAVLFQQRPLVAFFVQHFPAVMHARDHQGRTPLHYAAVLQDNGEIYRMLKAAGSDENATDVYGHTPDFYLDARRELTLEQLKEGTASSRSKKAKHRRRKSGENSTASVRGYSAKPAGLKVQIREVIGQGNLEALEELVLHGHGDRLLGETSPNPVVQEFLDIVPGYIEQISDVHRAVVRGRLREVQTLMSHRSLSLARDSMGCTPIHKAVMHGHMDVAQHLAENFRDSLSAKDIDGRTPLHYAAALKDGRKMYNMLIAAGSPTTIVDSKGKTADYYLQYPEKLGMDQIIKRNQLANATHLGNTVSRLKALAPPAFQKTIVNMHERYQHFNGALNGNHESHVNGDDESEGSQETVEERSAKQASQAESLKKVMMRTKPILPPVILPRLEVNSANIRKWIDEQDLQKLEGAVFEGYGERIAQEPSARHEQVEQYLRRDVPRLLERIQAIHRAVSEDDVRTLESQLQSSDYALARDHLGMTPLHRAIVLGRHDVVRLLVDRFPETINARDREGRTALHYAAAASRRSGRADMYRLLLQNGSDPRIRDNRGKSSEFYKTHHLPLAPEVAQMSSSARAKARSRSEPPGSKPRKSSYASTAVNEKLTAALQKGDPAEIRELILEGHGRHLLGRTSWNEEVRHLLKGLPQFLHHVNATHDAIARGDQGRLKELAASDAQLLRARNDLGTHPIHAAIEARNLEAAKLILDAFPAAINLKAPHGRNPLHLAALRRDQEMYNFLVESGADPKALDQKGKTAEYYLKSSRKRRSRSTTSAHDDTSRERSSSVRDTVPASVEAAARTTELETITVPADKGALGGAAGDSVDGRRNDQSSGAAKGAQGQGEEEATEAGGSETGQSGSSDGGGKDSDASASASERDVTAGKDVGEGTVEAVTDGQEPIPLEAAGAHENKASSGGDEQDSTGAGVASPSSSLQPTATDSSDGSGIKTIKDAREGGVEVLDVVASDEMKGDKRIADAAESRGPAEERNADAVDQGGTAFLQKPDSGPNSGDYVNDSQSMTAHSTQEQRRGEGKEPGSERLQRMKKDADDKGGENVNNAPQEEGKKKGDEASSKSAEAGNKSGQKGNSEDIKPLDEKTKVQTTPEVEKRIAMAREGPGKNSQSEGVTAAPKDNENVWQVANNDSKSSAHNGDEAGAFLGAARLGGDINATNVTGRSEAKSSHAEENNPSHGEKDNSESNFQEQSDPAAVKSNSNKEQIKKATHKEGANKQSGKDGQPSFEKPATDSTLQSKGQALAPGLEMDENATTDNFQQVTALQQDEVVGLAGHLSNALPDIKREQPEDQRVGSEAVSASDRTLKNDKKAVNLNSEDKNEKDGTNAPITGEANTEKIIENSAHEADGADVKTPSESAESQDKKYQESAKAADKIALDASNKAPLRQTLKKTKPAPEPKPSARSGTVKAIKNGMQHTRCSSSMLSLKDKFTKTFSRNSLNIDEKTMLTDTEENVLETQKSKVNGGARHSLKKQKSNLASICDKNQKPDSAATNVADKSSTKDAKTEANEGAKSSDKSDVNKDVSDDTNKGVASAAQQPQDAEEIQCENDENNKQATKLTAFVKPEFEGISSQSLRSPTVDAFNETKEQVLRAQGIGEDEMSNDDPGDNQVSHGTTQDSYNTPPKEAMKRRENRIQVLDQKSSLSEQDKEKPSGQPSQSDGTRGNQDGHLGEQATIVVSSASADTANPTGNVAPMEEPEINADSSRGAVKDMAKSQAEVAADSHENPEPTKPRQRSAEKRPNNKGSKLSSSTSAQLDRLNELIDVWIKEGDLLRLEHVVIAGQGERLLNKTSDDKQVQEFLGLVPAYMERIRTVHEAVVSGNLAQVRQVLTRKRFALSRDRFGASPLHLAVLHGHTDVLNYIVERFPETLDGPDNEGRTPLHYAAVVLEAQNYFDILKKAGADETLKDKMGHTPEYYLKNPKELSIRELLANYQTAADDDKSAKADVWQRPSTPTEKPEAPNTVPEAPAATAPSAIDGNAKPAVLPDSGKPEPGGPPTEVPPLEASKTATSTAPAEVAPKVVPPSAPQPGHTLPMPTEGVERQPVQEPLQTAVRLPLEHTVAPDRTTTTTGHQTSTLPEKKNGQNAAADMAQLAQSLLLTGRTPEEAQYLSSSVGDALVGALSAVAQQRPPDPVGFVASWLSQKQATRGQSARAPNTAQPGVNAKARDDNSASRANTISSSAT
ncbi:hypothetical protein V5799_022146, partial [Amblyomma americanum]